MKIHTIGFSVEDVELFVTFDVDFSKVGLTERFSMCECSNYQISRSDWKKELDELEKQGYEQNHFVVGFEKEYEEYKTDWKIAVDKMRSLLDTEGFLIGWSVEYDNNLMFVTDCTKEEMLDFFKKELDKAEKEQEENEKE